MAQTIRRDVKAWPYARMLLVLGFLLILAAPITVHFYILSSLKPNPQAPSGWPQYHSAWCHCSFRYPEDWEVVESQGTLAALVIKPKSVENDWVKEDLGLNYDGMAAKNGLVLVEVPVRIYNSGESPMITTGLEVGGRRAEFNIRNFSELDSAEITVSRYENPPFAPSFYFSFPVHNTIRQILASFDFPIYRVPPETVQN